ncbi:glycosyltransferase family 4 protein [Halorubrum ezzemoulense]|uniref:Glycosyltransferase family 4 protein n=1 Tax=Halorubrum ezzemoulense TaxID=337243 RepID=A0ABT4Z875_HALEZ|nr:glycosyltransferase family 4 protein [Halorubrum ezzemoulense]MDB2246549.1 glycosyltransferase family 4 protein [Halorubrum ezzemoulense]MDB2280199.1 glycosyltransferase family 4 protein [Halorubrum ezzemoulense]MDB2290628.1 glycosyltransferase family 4 protein [Halorubrum ezzemoulense]MDB2294383.1 glycosyltransferase family 4 protein [Halorubrum ezzemoulense]MDB2297852.1 glycosyltransferase family 4 protein [Halorubrum ezzemoulense]
MKIAFIHPRYPSSDGTGATYSATQIVNGLSARGHDLCVYCPREPNKQAQNSNLELRCLTGNSNHPHTMTRVNEEILSRTNEFHEFDIVHSYLMRAMPSIAKISQEIDINTVVTLNAYGGVCAKNDLLYRDKRECDHKSTPRCLSCILQSGRNTDTNYFYETGSQVFSLRLINRGESMRQNIDVYQALSSHVKETYTHFGFKTDKIEVIPNILDERFDIDHESNFTEPIKLLYVGYLKRTKGVDRLPEIISKINKKSDRVFKLTIVGDGELRQSVEQACLEREITDIVEFTGQIPNEELPSIYAEHDIFLYPGRWNEPFGRIFLEAMAAGTPVITTNTGSVKEIIGNAGVVTKQSVTSLIEAITSVVNNDELQTHSKAAKREINAYTESTVIPQFERLYESII